MAGLRSACNFLSKINKINFIAAEQSKIEKMQDEQPISFKTLSYATAAALALGGITGIVPQITVMIFSKSGTASPFAHDAVQLLGAADLTLAGASLAVASTKDTKTQRRFSRCIIGGLLLTAAVDLYIISQQSTRDFSNQVHVPRLLVGSAANLLFAALHATVAFGDK